MVTFWADAELVLDMERVLGSKDRSLFIREAIAEKLRKLNIPVPDELIHPPPRPRSHVVQVHNGVGHNYSLNETPPPYSSKKKKKPKK